MDGYAPGDPLVALSIAELATVESAPPSVATHSDALESNSLFCTVYLPPEAGAVCSWQSVVAAARALGPLPSAARTPPTTSSNTATVTSAARGRVIGYLRARMAGNPAPSLPRRLPEVKNEV